MKTYNPTNIISNNLKTLPYKANRKKLIQISLKEFRKGNNIIYGAQSIKKQLGVRGRPTFDYDVFSNNPKKDAYRIERQLEKLNINANLFFVKPALHPGTFKIMFIGNDLIKNTKDDVGVIDISKPDAKVRYKMIEGNLYRTLKEELKYKLKALKDPTQKFRWEKDLDDYNRIKKYLNLFYNKKI